ncbi:MAG: CDP-glucose 4,6-dehydratase, partial [Candidatus Goldiibacteriota bacterium]
GGDFAADRLIPDCVRAAMKGKEVIVRSPHSTRPYQHILDCIAGYLKLAQMQYDKKYEGSYNFGPDESDFLENGKVVDLFCEKWGNGIKRVDKSDGGPHEACFLHLDCTKAKEALGWQPKINIDKAVELTVEWTKEWLNKGNAGSIVDRQIAEYLK